MRTTYELRTDRPALAPRPMPAPPRGRSTRLLGGLAVALLTAASLWWLKAGAPAPAPQPAVAPAAASAQWWNTPSPTADTRPPPSAAGAADGVRAVPGERSFEALADGQLRLDARTQVKLEQLVALTAPDELAEVLEGQLQGLPATAATAARDLVQRYQAYVQAQKTAPLADREPDSPEAALAELDGLRALRQTHFGPDAAQRLFGDDEQVARRLLELMRDDPVPGASMDDKAQRAQARYDAERRAAPPADAGR